MGIDNYTAPEYRVNSEGGVIIGEAPAMLELFGELNRLANLPTTVLLIGETGTGKELCAMALHYNSWSERRRNKFVTVNCAGIPEELLESELFGHEKGAFTGAYIRKDGKFKYADNGSIFLDEIADMSPKLQAKILRTLDNQLITPVGSNESEKVNTRIIAATNKDLQKAMETGNFREDLYYRLSVYMIKLPPLNEREEDIPLIAMHLVKKYNPYYDSQIEGISKEAEEKLKGYQWKGNVRELQNVIERVFIHKSHGIIEAADIHFDSQRPMSIGAAGNVKYKWYSDGVLPVIINRLSKMKDAKPLNEIMKLINNGSVYTERKKQQNSEDVIIYMTPKNASSFFDRTDTYEYIELIRGIQNNGFHDAMAKPFKVYSVMEILANPNTYQNTVSIYKLLKAGNYSRFPGNRRSHYYLIPEEDASCFVSNNRAKKEKVSSFKKEILESYTKFDEWEPLQ